jgi:hypothetical protein
MIRRRYPIDAELRIALTLPEPPDNDDNRRDNKVVDRRDHENNADDLEHNQSERVEKSNERFVIQPALP